MAQELSRPAASIPLFNNGHTIIGDRATWKVAVLPFVMVGRYSAIDPETGSELKISSTPEIELHIAKFKTSEVLIKAPIIIRPKYAGRPIAKSDPSNPCLMISSREINEALIGLDWKSVDRNTQIVRRMVEMIAFINMNSPLAPVSSLWTDYARGSTAGYVYRMPSDDELLELSRQPGGVAE